MEKKAIGDVQGIIDAARRGEAAAFTQLVRRFGNMAYAYAVSLLGDVHLAEDAAQEAFIEVHRSIATLRTSAAFVSWLRRIVFKYCDRIIRKASAPTRTFDEEIDSDRQPDSRSVGGDPAQHICDSSVRQEVLAAIAALPEHERTVVSLFYTDDYSLHEIASFIGVSDAAVKSRLHRARTRLRTTLTTLMEETMGSFGLPDSFATTVAKIVEDEADLGGARKHLLGSYHDRKDPSQLGSLSAARDTGIYVVRDDEQVESAGYYNEVNFGIDGVSIRAARPDEVAGEAQGVPDPVFVRGFAGCFSLARRRGVNIAVAHGSMFDHGFIGFIPTFYHPVATATAAEVARLPASSATVRPIENQGERDAAHKAFIDDPYAAKIGGWAPRPMNYVVEHAGSPAGYLAYHDDWYGRPYLASATVHGRDAAIATLRFLAEHSGGGDVRVQETHMTDLTQAVLAGGGRYLIRPACPLVGLDNEMVAIINLPGLVEELMPVLSRRARTVAAHLFDGHSRDAHLSVDMEGAVVGFNLSAGELSLSDRPASVHRKLPRWVLTRLILGYYSGREVRGIGALPEGDGRSHAALELPNAEAALFDALFPKLWPASLPDPDVLPWVLGEPHPRYQNADAKSVAMRSKIDQLKFPWIGR